MIPYHSYKCDSCGKFMSPGIPGSSYLFVPGSSISYEEDKTRCVLCTSIYGAPIAQQNVSKDCSHIFAMPKTIEEIDEELMGLVVIANKIGARVSEIGKAKYQRRVLG